MSCGMITQALRMELTHQPDFSDQVRVEGGKGFALKILNCVFPMDRFLYGEAEYNNYVATDSTVKRAFSTIYFVVYVAVVVLLLSNLFMAMVIHTYQSSIEEAERVWRLRWTSYVLLAEGRMPHFLQRKYRLGEASYDPALQMRIYNHVFEVVEDEDAKNNDAQIKALESAIDRMKKGGKN